MNGPTKGRQMALVSWWRKRRAGRENGQPTDVVTAYARMLEAEEAMRADCAAAEAAAGELDRLIKDNGLITQIEDQAQRSTIMATTAQHQTQQYGRACEAFSLALEVAGLPADWTPEAATPTPAEEQLKL